MDAITQPTQQLNRRHDSKAVINALSVDLEEYYHTTVFQEATRDLSIERHSRVVAATDRLLSLLATRGATATFFVLGEVAAEHPALVRRIVGAGHEVACHGYRHHLVSRQRPEDFREDVSSAKALLEDIIGQPILGYRAPSFSINGATSWAYDVLLDLGFRYDSSSHPIWHDRYGNGRDPRFPYAIRDNGVGRLIEFPIGTTTLLGVRLPIGGGGYFRLLPFPVIRWGFRRVNRRERAPVLFYIHPWEMDCELPRPPMVWHHRFRHYVGIARTESKFAALLRDFPFTAIREFLGLRSLAPLDGTAPPARDTSGGNYHSIA